MILSPDKFRVHVTSTDGGNKQITPPQQDRSLYLGRRVSNAAPEESQSKKKRKKKRQSVLRLCFFDVRWCWIWSQPGPRLGSVPADGNLLAAWMVWNLSRSDISHLPQHWALFMHYFFKKYILNTRHNGGVWAGFFFSSCATKRALKSAGFVFIPCLEVSAPWLWMANYHRANGSRLSLLLVTWLYSSGVFFSPSLSFITRDDNGGFSVGETFFRIPPRS